MDELGEQQQGRIGVVNDDDVSLHSCATFSSEEENDDGGYVSTEDGGGALEAIKQNDPNTKKLGFYPYSPVLSPYQWISLGCDIGRNTNLKKLNIYADGLEEGHHQIASTGNLESFCMGLSHNRSLNYLFMEEFDFSRARLQLLRPFLIENSNLTDLRLHACGLSLQDIEMLADAFRQRRNSASIRYLGLTGREEINDESVPAIVELCSYCPRLKKIDLEYSGIGDQGCTYLATMLENPECRLKCLDLTGNMGIGDKGVRVFANALSTTNRTLKRLAIGSYDGDNITQQGWDSFLDVTRSTTCKATWNCNHVLERLSKVRVQKKDKRSHELKFCLQANAEMDKVRAVRKKIIHCNLSCNFNLSSFEDMSILALPIVLGWVGVECEEDDQEMRLSSRTAFFHILRSFPELCSFPSNERKMRLQLELENATLKANLEEGETEKIEMKAEIAKLKQRIDALMLENNQLKTNKRQKFDM